MNHSLPQPEETNRIDAIKTTLAKIRLRLKAHKAIDLHQINEMSEEILSALYSEQLPLEEKEKKELEQKGAYVQANLEKMREIIWEEDRKYLQKIYQIIFSIDELTYAIPFFPPELIEEKLEDLTTDLSQVVQDMTYFSPRVEEKIGLAYEKLKHIHFLSYHPISQELITFSYFPNFAQQIRKMAEEYRKGEEEKADQTWKSLSENQREKILSLIKSKKTDLTPEKKAKALESFLDYLDTLFLTAKNIFYGDESLAKQEKKKLDSKALEYVDRYIWSQQESKEPLQYKMTMGLISFLDEFLLN